MKLVTEEGRIIDDDEISLLINTEEGQALVKHLMARNRCGFVSYMMLSFLGKVGLLNRFPTPAEQEHVCRYMWEQWNLSQAIVDKWVEEAIEASPELYEITRGNA